MNDRHFDSIEVQNSAYRPVPGLQGKNPDIASEGEVRWLIAKESLSGHTFRIISRNHCAGVLPLNIAPFRRRLPVSSKRQFTDVAFHQAVLIDVRRNRSPAAAQRIRSRVAGQTMLLMLVRVITGPVMKDEAD